MARKKKQTQPEQTSEEFDFGNFGDFGGEWGDADFDPKLYDFLPEEEWEETRYCKPKMVSMHRDFVMYDNAEKLAKEIDIDKGSRYDIFVNGTFIFGDFIEAFLVRNNCKCKRMIISTLSMSQENVDSLANLLDADYIDKLDLIISHYFWSNERHNLVPYSYYKLDHDDKFQLSVASIHTKTVQIETAGGKFIVMHGSANLRSSANIEQFTIEENEELYRFYEERFDSIIDKYKTINKACNKTQLWEAMQRKNFKD